MPTTGCVRSFVTPLVGFVLAVGYFSVISLWSPSCPSARILRVRDLSVVRRNVAGFTLANALRSASFSSSFVNVFEVQS
jgi:hypothetical protein